VAILFCRAQVIKRSDGRSAVACAAYRCGMELYDERTGQTHDYTRKQGVMAQGILAPEGAPEWAKDPRQLWNRAEAAETRKDAQLAREMVIAIPHEIEGEHREYLIKNCLRSMVREGAIAHYAIHAPGDEGDERNYHAHIMLTMRRLTPEGEFSAKKERAWNEKQALQTWKKTIEQETNRMMERLGRQERVSVELEEGQTPTRHLGHKATALERKGIQTQKGAENREIEAENRRRRALHKGFEDTAREIAELEAKQRLELEERQKAARNREPAHTFERLKASRDLRAGLPPRPEVSQAPEDKREKTAREAAEAFDRLMNRGKIREKPPQAPQPPENEHQKAAREAMERLNARQGTRPQPSRQTQAGRAFAKMNQPQQTPEPPKRQSEQRHTFEQAARAPQEAPRIWQPETRRRGEGDAPTLKRPQTAEEYREKMKQCSGRERERTPDRD
jgi:hypothetical protein